VVLPPWELIVVWAAVAAGALAVAIALMVIGCQHCRGVWRADLE
jgi:hypothetical protein